MATRRRRFHDNHLIFLLVRTRIGGRSAPYSAQQHDRTQERLKALAERWLSAPRVTQARTIPCGSRVVETGPSRDQSRRIFFLEQPIITSATALQPLGSICHLTEMDDGFSIHDTAFGRNEEPAPVLQLFGYYTYGRRHQDNFDFSKNTVGRIRD